MLRFLLVSTALVGVSMSTAMAADVVVDEAPIEAPVATIYDWSGAYVGLFAGAGFGDASVTDVDGYNELDGTFSYDVEGFFGGAYAGYNFQVNQLVFGIEGEIGYLGLDGSDQYPDYVGVRDEDDSRASIETDLFASLTGRVGFAVDNILFYGKGGVAGLNTEVSFIDEDPTGTTLESGTSEEDFLVGYTVGAGLEVGFTPNLRGKVEYMFADFNDEISHTASDPFGTEYEFTHELEDIHTVKIGISYAF